MRPNLRVAHAFDHLPRHVEQRAQIGVDHRGPLLGLHAMQLRVAGDAGIVDQHLDRPEIGLDLLDAGGAGFERRHVPFVDRDAGLGLEFLRRLVVAGVIGGDLVAGGLERFGNRRADAAGSSRHDCDAWHDLLPDLSSVSARLRRHPPLVAVFQNVHGRDKPGHDCRSIVDCGLSRSSAPRTSRCPCRRRCTAWRAPSWRCASASRAAASPGRARRKRRSDGRARSRRH